MTAWDTCILLFLLPFCDLLECCVSSWLFIAWQWGFSTALPEAVLTKNPFRTQGWECEQISWGVHSMLGPNDCLKVAPHSWCLSVMGAHCCLQAVQGCEMTFETQVMYQAKPPLLGDIFFELITLGIASSVSRNGIVKYMLNTDQNHRFAVSSETRLQWFIWVISARTVAQNIIMNFNSNYFKPLCFRLGPPSGKEQLSCALWCHLMDLQVFLLSGTGSLGDGIWRSEWQGSLVIYFPVWPQGAW